MAVWVQGGDKRDARKCSSWLDDWTGEDGQMNGVYVTPQLYDSARQNHKRNQVGNSGLESKHSGFSIWRDQPKFEFAFLHLKWYLFN